MTTETHNALSDRGSTNLLKSRGPKYILNSRGPRVIINDNRGPQTILSLRGPQSILDNRQLLESRGPINTDLYKYRTTNTSNAINNANAQTIDSIADTIRIPIAAASGNLWAKRVMSNSGIHDTSNVLATMPEAFKYHIDNHYAGQTGSARLATALRDLGETADILANPIKGAILDEDIVTGFKKGLTGEEQYNFDTGNFLVDLGLEMVTDPINIVGAIATGGGSLFAKGAQTGLTKTGVSAAVNSLDDVARTALKSSTDDIAEGIIKTNQMRKILATKNFTNDEAIEHAAEIIVRRIPDANKEVVVKAMKEAANQQGSYAALKFSKNIIKGLDAMDSAIARVSFAPITNGLTLVPKKGWSKLGDLGQKYLLRNLNTRMKLPIENAIYKMAKAESADEFSRLMKEQMDDVASAVETKDAARRKGKMLFTENSNLYQVNDELTSIMKDASEDSKSHMFNTLAGMVEEQGVDETIKALRSRSDKIVTFTFDTTDPSNIKIVNLRITNQANLKKALELGAYSVYKGDYLKMVRAAAKSTQASKLAEAYSSAILMFKTGAIYRYSAAVRNFIDATTKAVLSTGNNIYDMIVYGYNGIKTVEEYDIVIRKILNKASVRPEYIGAALDEDGMFKLDKLLDAIKNNPYDSLDKYISLEDLSQLKYLNATSYEQLESELRGWSDFMIEGTGALTDIATDAAKIYNESRSISEALYGPGMLNTGTIYGIQRNLASDLNYSTAMYNDFAEDFDTNLAQTHTSRINADLQLAKAKAAPETVSAEEMRRLRDEATTLNKQEKTIQRNIDKYSDSKSQFVRDKGTPIDISSTYSKTREVFDDPKVIRATGLDYNTHYFETEFLNNDVLTKEQRQAFDELMSSTNPADRIPAMKADLYVRLKKIQKDMDFTIMDIVNEEHLVKGAGKETFNELDESLQGQILERLNLDRNLSKETQDAIDAIDNLIAELKNQVGTSKQIDELISMRNDLSRFITDKNQLREYLYKYNIIDKTTGASKIGNTTALDVLNTKYNDPYKVAAQKLEFIQTGYKQIAEFKALRELWETDPEEFKRKLYNVVYDKYNKKVNDNIIETMTEKIPNRVDESHRVILLYMNQFGGIDEMDRQLQRDLTKIDEAFGVLNGDPSLLNPEAFAARQVEREKLIAGHDAFIEFANKLENNIPLTKQELDDGVKYYLDKVTKSRRKQINDAAQAFIQQPFKEAQVAKQAIQEQFINPVVEELKQYDWETVIKPMREQFNETYIQPMQDILNEANANLDKFLNTEYVDGLTNKDILDWYLYQGEEELVTYSRFTLPTEEVTDIKTVGKARKALLENQKQLEEAIGFKRNNIFDANLNMSAEDLKKIGGKKAAIIRKRNKSIDWNRNIIDRQLKALEGLPDRARLKQPIELFTAFGKDDIIDADGLVFKTSNIKQMRDAHKEYIRSVAKREVEKNLKGFTITDGPWHTPDGEDWILDEIFNVKQTTDIESWANSTINRYFENGMLDADVSDEKSGWFYQTLISMWEKQRKIDFAHQIEDELLSGKAFRGSATYLDNIDNLSPAQEKKLHKYFREKMLAYNKELKSDKVANDLYNYITDLEKQNDYIKLYGLRKSTANQHKSVEDIVYSSMEKLDYKAPKTNLGTIDYLELYRKAKDLYKQSAELKTARKKASAKLQILKGKTWFAKENAELNTAEDFISKFSNQTRANRSIRLFWDNFKPEDIQDLNDFMNSDLYINAVAQSEANRLVEETANHLKIKASLYRTTAFGDTLDTLNKKSTISSYANRSSYLDKLTQQQHSKDYLADLITSDEYINYKKEIKRAKRNLEKTKIDANFNSPRGFNNETYSTLQDFSMKGTPKQSMSNASIMDDTVPEDIKLNYYKHKNMYDRTINKEQIIQEVRREGNQTAADILADRDLKDMLKYIDSGAYKELTSTDDGMTVLRALTENAEGVQDSLSERMIKAVANGEDDPLYKEIYNIAHKYAQDVGITEAQFTKQWNKYIDDIKFGNKKIILNDIELPDTEAASPLYILDSLRDYKDKHWYVFNTTETLRGLNDAKTESIYKAFDFLPKKLKDKLFDTNTHKFNYSPLAMFSKVESFARTGQYMALLDLGYTRGEALAEVINTQFDYTAKGDLISKLELAFPFLTFPVNNVVYWLKEIDKDPAYVLTVMRLYNAAYGINDKTDYELENNSQLIYNYMSGNIPLGKMKPGTTTTILKSNHSMFDAMQLANNPISAMEDRLYFPIKVPFTGKAEDHLGGSMLSPLSSKPDDYLNMIPFRSSINSTVKGLEQIPKKGITPQTMWRSMFGSTYNYNKPKYNSYTPYEYREGYWYDKNSGSWQKKYTRGTYRRIRYRYSYPRAYKFNSHHLSTTLDYKLRSPLISEFNNFKYSLKNKLNAPARALVYKTVRR